MGGIIDFLAKAPDPANISHGGGGLDPLGLMVDPIVNIPDPNDPTKPPKYFVNPYLDNLTALNTQRIGRSSLVNTPGSNPLKGLQIHNPVAPPPTLNLGAIQARLGINPNPPKTRPGGPSGPVYTP